MKLIVNTKRNSFSGNRSVFATNNAPVIYQLSVNGNSRPLRMRTFDGDIDIFHEILWKKTYASPYPEDITKIKTIIDLGANIGIASLFFRMKYPYAKIFAVEPDPDNFGLLLINMKKEIEENCFFPIQAAIAKQPGTAYIHKSEKAYNTKISASAISDLAIKVLDLNTLLSGFAINKVDLLKIDIEGAETEIFEGDLSFLPLVDRLVIECHSTSIGDYCKKKLIQRGFRISSNPKNANLLWAVKTAQ